jgi:aminobenzoyl-glutamate utilization protein B
MVGMPEWSEADQTLAKALQKEIGAAVDGLKLKVKSLEPRDEFFRGGSDDIGDISWNVPTVYLRYPANIPNLPGHSWENAVAMATPIAHKGSTAGAKVQATTALDFLLNPELVKQAWRVHSQNVTTPNT